MFDGLSRGRFSLGEHVPTHIFESIISFYLLLSKLFKCFLEVLRHNSHFDAKMDLVLGGVCWMVVFHVNFETRHALRTQVRNMHSTRIWRNIASNRVIPFVVS